MSPIAITNATLDATLEKAGIVVLDWWAPWCAPCRLFSPIFERAAARHPNVVWGKVDTDHEPELARAFHIRSIPTLMIFRDGILVFAQPGLVAPEALDELVRRAREIDMDRVRRAVVAEHAAGPTCVGRSAPDASASGQP